MTGTNKQRPYNLTTTRYIKLIFTWTKNLYYFFRTLLIWILFCPLFGTQNSNTSHAVLMTAHYLCKFDSHVVKVKLNMFLRWLKNYSKLVFLLNSLRVYVDCWVSKIGCEGQEKRQSHKEGSHLFLQKCWLRCRCL